MKSNSGLQVTNCLLVAWLTFCVATSVTAQTDTARLSQIIKEKIKNENFSGTVLIAKKGQPVLQVSSGYQDFERKQPIRNNTRFAIASITKMVAAIVILELVEEGKLKLDDKLSHLLPHYSSPNRDSISIHHLLLHISGLPNESEAIYQRPLTEDKLVEAVLKTEKPNPFGSFHYNNLDYVLLGLIIEKKEGKGWQDVIRERIINKLDLQNTGFLLSKQLPRNFARGYLISKKGKPLKEAAFHIENFFAAGAMYSNAADLLKIDQALYKTILLREESKKLMYTSYPQYNYTGYGVWTYKYPFTDTRPKIMERRGGIYGSNSVLVRFLDSNETIIILSNNNAFNPDSFGDKNNLREALIIALSRQGEATRAN